MRRDIVRAIDTKRKVGEQMVSQIDRWIDRQEDITTYSYVYRWIEIKIDR